MKVVIITFSPSGNTQRIGMEIKSKLEVHGIEVQLFEINWESGYFIREDKTAFLRENIDTHDILIVGGPVYAHHLQYILLDLIKSLPKPDEHWGNIAIPFITYGGIHSGIALYEGGKYLQKSGRKILSGLKVACSHRMTRAFLDKEYSVEYDHLMIDDSMNTLVNRINNCNSQLKTDNMKALNYQNLITHIKANVIFNEKKWHEKRYPNIVIDYKKCNACSCCITKCVVNHLKVVDGRIKKSESANCIHCYSCVSSCPNNAISIVGNLNKAREFFKKLTDSKQEDPLTGVYPL